jgi:ABC-type dipeptide/oligopeptide/nickel transport system ATPase component
MYLGRLVDFWPRPTVFEDPRHLYTRTLMSAVPAADPRRWRIHEAPSASPIAAPIFLRGCRPARAPYDEATPGHFVLIQN